MIYKHILLKTFLNKPKLFLQTVKGFQVLLYNSYNLTSIICLHTVLFYFTRSTLPGTTTPGQGRPGSDGNEGVLHIIRISKAGPLPSDLVSSLEHSLERGSYPSAEMQSTYFIAPTNWATHGRDPKSM